jgi:DDE superfamily endonuclease
MMTARVLSADGMSNAAREALGMPLNKVFVADKENKVFRGFFGAPVEVVADIWNRILPLIHDEYKASAKPKHLLWALVFIKIYSTEEVHCRIVGWPDPKTFRKWSWYFLQKIANMKDDVILLDNRLQGYDGSTNSLMSVDGTDCPTMEPWPFDPKWYSHKFNGPGVKYEVGVCIKTGYIVWVNGPFVASTGDATIFKNTLSGILADDEGVEVDKGYGGDNKLKSPQVNSSQSQKKEKAGVRARHENVNSRLKIYNVLNIPFRHLNPRNTMMEKHGMCFNAIAVITQLKFESGEKLYDVKYDSVNYF